MPMKPQRVALSPDVIFRDIEGESILLDLKGATYFGLDEVGTRIWQLLQEHGELSAVYDRMLLEFDVEPERLAADLDRLVRELSEHGLAVLSPAASEAP